MRKPTDSQIYLNMGCGKRLLPGYVNIDIAPETYGVKPDLCRDVTCDLDDYLGRVDHIYAGHVLEHLKNDSATLAYWVRLLTSGGTMLVVVPDIDAAVRAAKNLPTPRRVQRVLDVIGSCEHEGAELYRFHRHHFWPELLRSNMVEAGLVDLRTVHPMSDEVQRRYVCQCAFEGRKP